MANLVGVSLSPGVLAELQDLARKQDVGNRARTLLQRVRTDVLLRDYEVVAWDASADQLTVRLQGGTPFHMAGVQEYLGDAVETLMQAGVVEADAAAALLAPASPSTDRRGLLDADPATQLTWIVALLTALFQSAKFGADAAGSPLPTEVADAADALAAIAAVLILIITRNRSQNTRE